MQKILIIEDDKVIARTLKEHLCKWDYDADFVVDFKNITEQECRLRRSLYSLI